TTGLAAEAIREVAGQQLEYRRFSRNGDQSFWGTGLPGVFVGLSHPAAQPTAAMAVRAAAHGVARRRGGSAWWWHTTEDTIDKIDPANLARDTRVYVLVCDRLCNAAVLPLDYQATAAEIRDAIKGYAEKAGGPSATEVDLGPSVEAAERLVAAAAQLDEVVAGLADSGPSATEADRTAADRVNGCLM